jgi:hypothetical protein
MNNKQINSLIESTPYIYRDMNRPYGSGLIALDRYQEYMAVGCFGQDLVDLFISFPNGETDKYQWETRRVDQLINLHIWIKRG